MHVRDIIMSLDIQLQRNIIISLHMQEVSLDTNKPNQPTPITCYLCGRQFGSRGFSFHHKECILKFTNEQHNKKTSKDKIKFPDTPQQLQEILKGNYSDSLLKKYNQEAKNIYKYKVLPACKYCQRTFNSQSLAAHIKGCSKKSIVPSEKQNEVQGIIKVPKALVCCVCGQRFGTSSLRIHYPECIKKFNNEQFRKHKRQEDRRKPPQFSAEDQAMLAKADWKDSQMEEFNQRATANHRDKGMAQCDNCGRKFFFQQIAKHRKNCELINGKLNIGKKLPQSTPSKVLAKPKVIVCVICGRQYGASSINIHSIQCEQLFVKQQKLKPKQQRKKMPALSAEVLADYDLKEAQKWSAQKIDKYNRLAFDCFNFKSLSKCYICTRTFFEESLGKHLKDCESKIKDVKKLERFKKLVQSKKQLFGDNFIETVIEMNKQPSKSQTKEAKKPKMLVCLLCGREYGITSLKIHLPQCRGHSKQKKQGLQKILQEIKTRYNINQADKWTHLQIQKYNKQVFELYKKESLHECRFCHRTFFEESLIKHIKHCQKQSKKKGQLRRCRTTYQTIQNQSGCQAESERQISLNQTETQSTQKIERVQSQQYDEYAEMKIDENEDCQNGVSCDLLGSMVIPQVEGEESPTGAKSHQNEGEQKLMRIPILQFIQIEDF